MTTLTMRSIATVALQAGFPRDARKLAVATAVASAESRGNCEVYNHICCYGLWQVYQQKHQQYSIAELKTCLGNAKAMIEISGHGTNWHAWSTYNSGVYLAFMPAALVAANSALRGQQGRSPHGGTGQQCAGACSGLSPAAYNGVITGMTNLLKRNPNASKPALIAAGIAGCRKAGGNVAACTLCSSTELDCLAGSLPGIAQGVISNFTGTGPCVHPVQLGPVNFCADVLIGGVKIAAGGLALGVAGLAILYLLGREVGAPSAVRAVKAVAPTPIKRAYRRTPARRVRRAATAPAPRPAQAPRQTRYRVRAEPASASAPAPPRPTRYNVREMSPAQRAELRSEMARSGVRAKGGGE